MNKTLPSANYRGVLFDLDGTLLDTAPDFVTALNRLLAENDKPGLEPAVIRAAVTNGSAGLVTLGFGLRPDEPGFDALKQRFLDLYLECLCDHTCLFAGMESVLCRLTEMEIPWGIVTNKPQLYTRAILDRLWLPCAPQAIVCPDHVRQTKPHPEPVLLGCRQLRVEPGHTLVVGDHLRDIQSGLGAGCHTASAAYGYLAAGEDPALWGAHHLIRHAAELNDIIRQPQQSEQIQ